MEFWTTPLSDARADHGIPFPRTRLASKGSTTRKAVQLLKNWMDEDAEAGTDGWEFLKSERDRDRLSGRKLCLQPPVRFCRTPASWVWKGKLHVTGIEAVPCAGYQGSGHRLERRVSGSARLRHGGPLGRRSACVRRGGIGATRPRDARGWQGAAHPVEPRSADGRSGIGRGPVPSGPDQAVEGPHVPRRGRPRRVPPRRDRRHRQGDRLRSIEVPGRRCPPRPRQPLRGHSPLNIIPQGSRSLFVLRRYSLIRRTASGANNPATPQGRAPSCTN